VLDALFTDYTLRTVALGAAALGIVSGGLGTFAVLRGQSLLGDAISHAALPGIALAFLFTGSKAPLVLVAGAGAAGWVGTLAVRTITGRSRVPFDAALGMVLSVFFGVGLVLLTYIQGRPDASQAGLDKFLFGQAAALVTADVITIAGLGAAALAIVALLWKEFKMLAFDPDYAAALGFRVGLLDALLTTLLVVAIVVGLQTVGVVLMSAMLIAPAAAARQWTDRLGRLVVLAALFGAASGVAGAVVSATTTRLPTGPTIVLCASALVLASLLFAPGRGIVSGLLRAWRGRRSLRVAGVLEDLYALGRQHADPQHGHTAATLRTMTLRPESVEPTIAALVDRGLVAPAGADAWALTPAGVAEAEKLSGRGGDER
jgi:manganese/zinc/iron transport system permease protein